MNEIEKKVKRIGGGVKNDLPIDLIFSILSLLPAKSVGRFRCVCKQWKSLLSDPQFLKKHFFLNTLQTDKSIFSVNYSFFSIEFHKNDKVPIFKTLDFKFSTNKPKHSIYGSCNGLILLCKSIARKNHELLIINPITHESRKLPPLPGSHRLCIAYSVFGFGYCSYNDDYVVVVIPNIYSINNPVYVLKMNTWKIAQNFPVGLRSCSGVFVNGTIYWSGFPSFRDLDGPRVLYAFDLVGDAFRELELPMAMGSRFLLHSLGGRLTVFIEHLDSNMRNSTIDTWVMNEFGGSVSWSKISENTLSMRGSLKPLFMWNDDEYIAGLSKNEGFVSFCLKKNIHLPYTGEGNTQVLAYNVWNFTDSLFSPSGCNATNLRQCS